MKQKIFTLALAAMAMVGFQAMAKAPKGGKAPCATPCDTAVCTSAPCAPGVCETAVFCGPDFFEGITLTDAQKTQLQSIKQNRDSLRRDKARLAREDKAARRDNRAKADSARIAARKADSRAYLAQIKEVLSPDQYVTFLENVYVNTPQGPRKGMAPGKCIKGAFGKATRDGARTEKVSFRRDGKKIEKGLKRDGNKAKAELRRDYKKVKAEGKAARYELKKVESSK